MTTPNDPRPSLLEALPFHLQEEVCEHLVGDPLHKRALSALAQASRQLHSATSRLRYRSIQIVFSIDRDLIACVDHIRSTLRKWDCAGYVRRITLAKEYYSSDDRETLWPPEAWPPEREMNPFPLSRRAWPLDRDDEFWTLPETTHFVPSHDDPWSVEEETWRSVGHLISILPGLKDFFYQGRGQIAAPIFRALEEHPGPVRLHMDSFGLRSLYQIRHEYCDMSRREYELMTSRRLSSVRLVMPIYGADFLPNSRVRDLICFTEDAVHDMVKGLSPNLKSVSIDYTHLFYDGDEDEVELVQDTRPPWRGPFFEGQEDSGSGRARPQGKGALESLSFGMGAPLDEDLLSQWTRLTDFGLLRSLHLRSMTMRLSALEELVDIAEAGGLTSLRHLSLWTRNIRRSSEDDDQERIDIELARLFHALPPLTTIELNGIFNERAFNSTMFHHGASLRRLRLVPARGSWVRTPTLKLNASKVKVIATFCPHLEDLELMVPRMLGGEKEAAIYGELSRLRRLDRLSLLLDPCANARVAHTRGEIEPEDRALYTRDTYDAVINAVIDAPLAASIFNSLCRGRAPRLIRLHPVEIGNWGDDVTDDSVYAPVDCLGRVWMRLRDDGSGSAGGFETVGVRTRKWRRREEDMGQGHDYNDAYLASLLRSVWPESGGDLTKMRSYPLWQEGDDAAS